MQANMMYKIQTRSRIRIGSLDMPTCIYTSILLYRDSLAHKLCCYLVICFRPKEITICILKKQEFFLLTLVKVISYPLTSTSTTITTSTYLFTFFPKNLSKK